MPSQVQDGDQSSVAASTARTLPSAPSTTVASAKSQVRRIYEFDLTQDADDCWYEDGEREVRRLNEVDCEASSPEDASRNESPAHAAESDGVHDFDVFARDESLCDTHSSLRVNMWDDPDGHVSEGACASEDGHSECSLDELRSTSSFFGTTWKALKKPVILKAMSVVTKSSLLGCTAGR